MFSPSSRRNRNNLPPRDLSLSGKQWHRRDRECLKRMLRMTACRHQASASGALDRAIRCGVMRPPRRAHPTAARSQASTDPTVHDQGHGRGTDRLTYWTLTTSRTLYTSIAYGDFASSVERKRPEIVAVAWAPFDATARLNEVMSRLRASLSLIARLTLPLHSASESVVTLPADDATPRTVTVVPI